VKAALGGFLGGAADGFMFASDMKERKERRDELREDRRNRGASDYAERYGPMPTGHDPSWGMEGDIEPQSGGGGDARPYKTDDPVLEGLAPHQKAFLNAVAGGESGGRYNVRYTPAGGANFSGYDQHPGIMESGPHGQSSAAGRYQFTKSTWDELGGGSFDPKRQDMRALKLASTRYRAITGRNLDDDLQASGLTSEIMKVLTPTWHAFKGGHDRHIATYNDSLARYSRSGTQQAAARTGVVPPTEEWGSLKRVMEG
jgi:muramidase (phage lysozyme)